MVRPCEDARMVQKLGVCNLCEAICGLVFTLEDGPTGSGSPTCAATPTTRCRAGTSAPRRSRSRTCTRTPTGCAARCAASATRWQEVSLGRGARPGRRRTSPGAVNEHGRDALAIYLGNPNVHSLGSMTHGTAMVKSFRTRNKYSATSVDQLPAQLLAYLMYGHQLLLPVPDIDRTDLLPGLRRQPDGLQRQR